jgi:hypothetical protein
VTAEEKRLIRWLLLVGLAGALLLWLLVRLGLPFVPMFAKSLAQTIA